MTRKDFLKILRKLDACGEGYDTAAASKGAVFTVAKAWRDSYGWTCVRQYYDWLKQELDSPGNLTRKEYAQMVDLMHRLEPNFMTRAERAKKIDLEDTLNEITCSLSTARSMLNDAQDLEDSIRSDLENAHADTKMYTKEVREKTIRGQKLENELKRFDK